MNNIYLTKELKDYYMDDFNSNVLVYTDRFWSIDEGIKDSLIKINQNNNIQTLYSKKHQFNGGLESESYIEFSYAQTVELEIFRYLIPYFLIIYNNLDEDKFIYQFQEPRKNVNYQENNNHPLGCLNNEDYFNINTLRFELTSYNKLTHDKFYDELTLKLSEL